MDKPSFKLVGSPCGQHGQYTFYKALRICGAKDRIIAVGDFFFLQIWQDSELVSIGELQLLWTDRVSDQTLVSLRLYFLPENTPDGRNQHGEDEVLALNEKVVLRADDLLSWLCEGSGWRVGLRAVWRGACAPPPHSEPLHHTKLDFSDVDSEKNAIETDTGSPGVVVFSYPRYCRYRALLKRLQGLEGDWLRDSLVAALGGYAATTTNTTILYCKDTFEYPELEGHEFVVNHMAPRLKGRPRGRRRRPPRDAPSPTASPTPRRASDRDSRSSDSDDKGTPPPLRPAHRFDQKISPRRLSLRNGASDKQSEEEDEATQTPEELAFVAQLRRFFNERGETLAVTTALKHLSLLSLYTAVVSRGGYEAVSRSKLWRAIHRDRPARVRSLYERFLLPFENAERQKVKPNGKLSESDTTDPIDTIHLVDSPTPTKDEVRAEELNRQFLDSLPKDEKPILTIKPASQLLASDKQTVLKLFEENRKLVAELSAKYLVADTLVLQEVADNHLSDGSSMLLSELTQRIQRRELEKSVIKDLTKQDSGANALNSLSALGDKYTVNGHTGHAEQKSSRPATATGRSSLRHVRVKPARPLSAANTPPIPRSDSASSSPPSLGAPPPPASTALPHPLPLPLPLLPAVTNFGIHHPPPPAAPASDDDIVEVPYKPKTPEIIDLDEYPESPQSAKKKKLDILKERGLEVTPIPTSWGPVTPSVPLTVPLTGVINPPMLLNPSMQHQIMTQASLFQMYNIIPQNYANGIQPPKVIQSTCIYGNTGPEKTVYGNPKDPFMPPPHILHGTPIKTQKNVNLPTEKPEPRQDILDLTCKSANLPNLAHGQKPAVEIVRIPTVPSPKTSSAQNLTKNYTLLDGKAVVGSNLEITLVSPKSQGQNQTPPKNRPPQKRSSNGKFVSTKTPTPPKEYQNYPKNYPSPSGLKSPSVKKNPITIPNYPINREEISPTSSTGSRDSQTNINNLYKGPSFAQILDPKSPIPLDPKNPNLPLMEVPKGVPMSPFMDPMYMSALYSSLAGQIDQRQLAMYRDLMASQFRYSGLLGGVGTPTTKN